MSLDTLNERINYFKDMYDLSTSEIETRVKKGMDFLKKQGQKTKEGFKYLFDDYDDFLDGKIDLLEFYDNLRYDMIHPENVYIPGQDGFGFEAVTKPPRKKKKSEGLIKNINIIQQQKKKAKILGQISGITKALKRNKLGIEQKESKSLKLEGKEKKQKIKEIEQLKREIIRQQKKAKKLIIELKETNENIDLKKSYDNKKPVTESIIQKTESKIPSMITKKQYEECKKILENNSKSKIKSKFGIVKEPIEEIFDRIKKDDKHYWFLIDGKKYTLVSKGKTLVEAKNILKDKFKAKPDKYKNARLWRFSLHLYDDAKKKIEQSFGDVMIMIKNYTVDKDLKIKKTQEKDKHGVIWFKNAL